MEVNGQLKKAQGELLATDPTGTGNITGRIYYDTVNNQLRYYNGTAWGPIGSGSGSQLVHDKFSGTGAQTAFTLSQAPVNEDSLFVFLNGVFQDKDQYSVSGTTLTFSVAPIAGTDNVRVVQVASLNIGTPADNSVSTIKIQDSAVTYAKISQTGTYPATQTFSSSGTWNKPSNLKYIRLTVVGGGGGGGGVDGDATGSVAASGGSGAAWAEGIILASDLPSSVTVTIGSGGTGAASGNNNGSAGGDSSFGTLVVAEGGTGGNGGAAAAGVLFKIVRGPAGGSTVSGTATTESFKGGEGGYGLTIDDAGAAPQGISGHGGGSYKGITGAQSIFPATSGVTSNGNNSSTRGTGGSGAVSLASATNGGGGDGAPGIIIVREFYF